MQDRLNKLLETQAEQMKQLENTIKGMDQVFEDMLAQSPIEDREVVLELQTTYKRALQLAKSGDRNGAEQLLKTFRDGRKNHQQDI